METVTMSFNASGNNISSIDDVNSFGTTEENAVTWDSNSTGLSSSFQTAHMIVYIGVLPVLVLGGVIGNILSMVILCREKNKNSTSVSLFGLAVVDLLYLLAISVVLYVRITNMFAKNYGRWLLMQTITPFNAYILPLPSRVGNWITAMIAIERAVAVTRPMIVKRLSTKKSTLILHSSSAVIIILITVPNAFLYELQTVRLPDGNTTTVVALGSFGRQTKAFEIYTFITESLLRFIPMGVVIICNIIIIASIYSSAAWRKQNTDTKTKNEEIQITKTLLTITLVFVICLLPITISRLMSLLDGAFTFYEQSTGMYKILLLIGSVTETLNSAVNFIIYIAVSSKYRDEFRKLCCTRTESFKRSEKKTVYAISRSTESNVQENQ